MPISGGIKTDDTLTGTLGPLISVVDMIGIKQHKLVKDHSANITAGLVSTDQLHIPDLIVKLNVLIRVISLMPKEITPIKTSNFTICKRYIGQVVSETIEM